MKKLLAFCAVAGCLAFVASSVHAQGTTIQQPVFSFNTTTTTVTAPDGGTVQLGGIKRASQGRVENSVPVLGKIPFAGRLFNNRGIGQDFQSIGTSVTPRIIILEEEEAKLGLQNFSDGGGGVLGAAMDRRLHTFEDSYRPQAAPLTESDVKAIRLSQHVNNNFAPVAQEQQPQQVGPSPDELRRRNELAAQQRSAEAVDFYERGRAAEQAGKNNVAKIYYNMAAKRASGDFKARILQRLEAVTAQ